MKGIEINTWYRVIIDGEDHIVRISGNVMKYVIEDYYDGRLWYVGNLRMCKLWIIDRRGKYGL